VHAGIRARRFPTSRGVGLITEEALPAGARVLEIPERLWAPLSAESVRSSFQERSPIIARRAENLGARLAERASSFEGTLMLALMIMDEGSTAAFDSADPAAAAFAEEWRAVAVPEQLSISTPYFYDAAQLVHLKGSEQSLRATRARREFIRQVHASLYPPAAERSTAMEKALGNTQSAPPPSLAKLEWALAVASSRVTTAFDGAGVTLLPILDFLNHAGSAANCRHDYDGDARSFSVETVAPVAAGEELTISYGAHANSKLLRVYGFATDENPHDRALLRVRWDLWEDRRGPAGFDVIAAAEAPPPPADFELSAANPLPGDLLGAMRLWMCDEAEWTALRDGSSDADPTRAPLSAKNERAAIGALGADTVATLEKYASFGCEGEEAALRGGATGAERDCALVRLGEKRILHATLARLTEMRDRL
jgi:hypothetical protein